MWKRIFIVVFIGLGFSFMGGELEEKFYKAIRGTYEVDPFKLEEIEQKELDLLATYLPQALSGEELKTVISEIISENGFSGMQDMGNVMKELKIKHSNAEMSEASSFVKELLS